MNKTASPGLAGAPEAPEGDQKTDRVVEEFIEQMGLSAQNDGLPRIAGRMMGFFLINAGPWSFSELAEHLQISRGSVSNNARLLRSLGVIELTSRPGDRQDYYRLAEDPYGRLLEGHVARLAQVEANAAAARRALPVDWTSTRGRLQEVEDFYRAAIDTTMNLIERWREKQAGKDEG